MEINKILTENDIKFLKELANELKTQDNLCTAKPLVHQIMENEYEYGYDLDYAEGRAMLISEESEPFHTAEEAKEWLNEWNEPDDDLIGCEDFEDIENWCEERKIRCSIIGYKKKEKYQNAFLTRKACEKHIQQNYYHYEQDKDTICYTNHGWRNPELQRLLEIVEKFADKEGDENDNN